MKAVVVALLFFVCLNLAAQDWAKVQERVVSSETMLRVGDKVPFTEMHNMLNYPKKVFKLSDHKPKLMLLDFWSTSCSPCIKFWPTALKLQEEFKGDLQIVLVDHYESSKKVKAFLEKRKKIDGFDMTLPMSNRDSTLWKNFPLETLPKYAWIGQDGVIGAITDTKDVTRENIQKWITTGPFSMTNVDQRKIYTPRPSEPIFVNGNGGDKPSDVFLWTSSLSKGQVDNPAWGWIFYDSLNGYGITITNAAIFHLYGMAYNNRLRETDHFDFLTRSRMQLIAKDTLKYYDDGSLGGNTFNYQLISRTPQSRAQLLKMMRQDLDRYFGLEVKWEKQSKKSLVFTMTDSTLATKLPALEAMGMMRVDEIILDSVRVKDITTLMEMGTSYYRDAHYPLIDETGYKGLITGIREKNTSFDPVTLDKIFSRVGLRMKFEMREVDVLVLREPAMSEAITEDKRKANRK